MFERRGRLIALLLGPVLLPVAILARSGPAAMETGANSLGHTAWPAQSATQLYLPIINDRRILPTVNGPYFDGPLRFSETAIFWFGHITPAGRAYRDPGI